MLVKGTILTIEGDNLRAIITYKGPILGIEHKCDDEELYNFDTIAMLEKNKVPVDFDSYSNLSINYILKGQGYVPGQVMGKRVQGWTNFLLIMERKYQFRFGYQPTKVEIVEVDRKEKAKKAVLSDWYQRPL